MAYWKDWLVTYDIPVEQLDPTLLRKWVLRMEEVVGDVMQNAIPEEWSALADHNNDNDIEINLGDLPHENDEDD
jgi:hypothetical protein